jgi:ribonuclease P/MRP protein subunit RPP40
MLSFNQPALFQASKCYVTHGVMGHLDPKQLPTKSKPWSTLTSHDFVHRVGAAPYGRARFGDGFIEPEHVC